MTCIATKLDAFFGTDELPFDQTGCLYTVAQLMHESKPSLLLLANSEGRLIGVEEVDGQGQPEAIHHLASQISTALVNRPLCSFTLNSESNQSQLAFGIRLSAETNGGILAGVICDSAAALSKLENLHRTLVACGSLVWLALDAVKHGNQHARRSRHLSAEQSTLRRAHADIVAAVIEEREERSQQQRDYVIHLEQEVDKRSRELRNAMNKAKEASLAKSTFLANMSHEIRTPMTAILGYADVLFEGGNINDAPPHRVEAINTIRRNGHYLVELINDILDIAKIEAGKLHVERVPCDPGELIVEVVELMAGRAKEKGLSLSAEVDGQIPATVQSDATRVRQILINLVGNAIKFTDAGGVRIVARCEHAASDHRGKLQLDIVDTGIGMSGPQMAKLFQPFSQIGDSASNRTGGTGLGLALSRRLARALGGDIRVTSIPGGGSTFRATIGTGALDGVAMISEFRTIGERRRRDAASQDRKMVRCDYRILLAEDGQDNQKLIKYILERAGAEVTVVENGSQAIQAVHDDSPTKPFDLILMDMQMPIMDGYQASTLLRKQGFHKPIIALTAHAMSGDRQKCIDAGCSDFATKPIDRASLIDLIATWCEPEPARTSHASNA